MSNQLNLILKSPHLSRCKVLLTEQVSKSINLKLSSPRHMEKSSSGVEWNKSNSGSHNNKIFSHRISGITQTSEHAVRKCSPWSSIKRYIKDIKNIKVWNYDRSHNILFNQDHASLGPQYIPSAYMSYDSSNKVHNRINDLITKSKKRAFVFMKGVPSEPSCRYSGVVVQILDAYGVEYDSCDVLEDADIRQELKSYSDWPTIPQVYMDGSFIGGCDILLQMHQSGELKQLFGDGSKSSDNNDHKP